MNRKFNFSLIMMLLGLFCFTSCGSTKVAQVEYKNFEEAYYSKPEVVMAFNRTVEAMSEGLTEIFSEIKVYAKENNMVYEYKFANALTMSKEEVAAAMQAQVEQLGATIPKAKEGIKAAVGYNGDIGVTYLYKDVNGEEIFTYTFN